MHSKRRRKRPPQPTVLYVDECMGGRKVIGPLLEIPEIVEIRPWYDEVRRSTDDIEWLAEIGHRGWCAITKDDGIRRKPAEKEVVRAAQVGLFIFPDVTMAGEEMAEILLEFVRRVGRFCARHPKPFIAKIERDGSVTLVEDFKHGWQARYGRRAHSRR